MSKRSRLPRHAKAASRYSSPQSPHSSNDSFTSVSSYPQATGAAATDISPVNVDRFGGSGSASVISGILADIAEENHSSSPPSPIQPSSLVRDSPPSAPASPPPQADRSSSVEPMGRTVDSDGLIMPRIVVTESLDPESQNYQYAQPREATDNEYDMYEAMRQQVKTSFLTMLHLNNRLVQLGHPSVTPPPAELLEHLGISASQAFPSHPTSPFEPRATASPPPLPRTNTQPQDHQHIRQPSPIRASDTRRRVHVSSEEDEGSIVNAMHGHGQRSPPHPRTAATSVPIRPVDYG